MRARNTIVPVLLFLALTVAPALAGAATVTGRVASPAGAGVAGMDVRLWAQDPKNYRIQYTATTNASGDYTLSDVEAGRYLLNVRMRDGLLGFWSDRWYDVEEPSADGWLASAADVLALDNDTTLSDVNVTVRVEGGITGRVLVGGTPTSGILVRAERASQPAYHHHELTEAVCCAGEDHTGGRFFMRGLIPADDYRLIVFDIDGRYEPQIISGPLAVAADASADAGDMTATAMPADPYEPNDSPSAGGATSIDSSLFRGEIPDVFRSAGSLIGPRNGDIDYYCIETQLHDRFIATTTTDMGIPGEFTDHPFTDVMLAFVSGDGSRIIVQNDDVPGFGFNAAVDTGDIPTAGRYCFVVTTYGDMDFDGTGQESAGRYSLIVELGNRVPQIRLTVSGGPAPEPPGRAIVDEGASFRVDYQVSDPDDDVLDIWVSHVDNEGVEFEDGTLTIGDDGRGNYAFTIPDDGASHSPYEITVSVSDGEHNVHSVVLVDPRGVNLSPEPPTPYSPDNGGTVASWTPTVEIQNAVDPDGDELMYEFEIHYGEADETPDEQGVSPGDESGITGYTLTPVEENEVVTWRARANDGIDESGVSPWTEYWSFVVNVENEPPTTPELIKPDEQATVVSRSPAITALNSDDPDGDTIRLVYEIATNADFTEIVATSEPVAQDGAAGRTTWNVTPELEWGASYYARVFASDPLDASSDYSNVRAFRVKNNQEPEEPVLGGEFGAECANVVFSDDVPTEFVVGAVVDPEGEPVTIDFRIYDYAADVEVDPPLFQETREQDAAFTGEHVFVPPAGLFAENGHYLVRVRASDGAEDSSWGECDFRLNSENSLPGGLEFIEPVAGTVFSATTDEVRVVVRNATDPDGESLTIAWCAVNALANETCPEDHRLWNDEPQARNVDNTEFYIEGLFPGAEVLLQACAFDSANACGPIATTSFVIDTEVTEVTPSLCGCDVAAGSRRDTGGWILLWGAVFVALRRRR